MDFKNLLSNLGALSSLLSNQNINQQNSQHEKFGQSSGAENSVCYYPQDFSSQPQQLSTGKVQNSPQDSNNSQISNYPQQNLLGNLSQLFPLLSLIFGKGGNFSSLLSKDSNLNQILNLFSKQEEKPKVPPIDSYKKIE